MAAENMPVVTLEKKVINIETIEEMAKEIKISNKVGEGIIQKLKGLTIKLTEDEYKAMYIRKNNISTDLTVQEYVANLIRSDLKKI